MKVHDELAFMSATELLARIGRRDLSPVEVVDAFLERIGQRNKALNAYVLVLADEARQKARAAEKALTGKQEHPPLLGLPIAIKDLFDMKAGVPNTFGCKPFKDYVPDASATYVRSSATRASPTTTCSGRQARPSTSARTRAVRRAAAPLRSRRGSRRSRRAPMAAARSASRPRGAAFSGSSRRLAGWRRSRGRTHSCSRCHSRTRGRWRDRSPTLS